MHTIKLNVNEKVYKHIMFFLSKLDKEDVEIIEVSKNKYSFRKYAGKLKWNGNPVKEQRKLRDE